MSDVDPTTLKDRGKYYRERIVYLKKLLDGTLSPKQRREAQAELEIVSTKALRNE